MPVFDDDLSIAGQADREQLLDPIVDHRQYRLRLYLAGTRALRPDQVPGAQARDGPFAVRGVRRVPAGKQKQPAVTSSSDRRNRPFPV